MTAPTVRDIGCGRVYSVSYSGRLDLDPADSELLRGYVDTFRESTRSVREWLMELNSSGPAGRSIATLLLAPSKVHPEVLASPEWAAAGSGWQALAGPNLYQMLRELVVPGGQSTVAGRRITGILAQFGLTSPLLSRERFDAMFGGLRSEGARAGAATASAGSMRSLFSGAENVRSEIEHRAKVRDLLSAQFPAFFPAFHTILDDASRWRAACRHLRDVRRDFRADSKTENAIVAACQRVLVFSRPELSDWHTSKLVTEAEHATASRNPEVMRIIAAALPSSSSPAFITDDIFRRLSPNGDIFAVAKDAFCARTIINLYDDQFHVFDAAERARIPNQIVKSGPHLLHVGWQELINSQDPRGRAFRKFASGPVRDYVRSCRLVRTPAMRPNSNLWPLWDEGAERGWSCVERRPDGVGNALRLRVRIPPFGEHESSRDIVATLRGHVPIAKARVLAAPMKVRAGLIKFLPDVAIGVKGAPDRRTFAKAQALRIMFDGAGFKGSVCSAQVTQLVSSMDEAGELPAGGRVGILHMLPGGQRIATLAAFERTASGWNLIRMDEEVSRSDKGSFKAGVRVRNTAVSERQFVHLESDALDHKLSLIFRGARDWAEREDRVAIARASGARAEVSSLFMRRAAARVASILVRNGIGDLVVAGGGWLMSREGVSLPVRDLYALRSVANRRVPTGYLVTALQKAGIRLHVTHARFATVLSRGYRAGGDTPLRCGVPYHVARTAELPPSERPDRTRRISKGIRRRLLDVETGADHDFALNAAWSIILGWSDPDFERRAEMALDRFDKLPHSHRAIPS